MIYRCGCCLISATAENKVAWCCVHDTYECARCWWLEHSHLGLWGEDCEEHDAHQDESRGDPG